MHKSKFAYVFFHRAKPVTEVERSGTEVHCGPAGSGTEVPSNQQRRCYGTDTNSNFLLLLRRTRAGSYRIYDREGFSFSLVAYTDKVEGLTIKGAKYEVEDCLLTNAFPLGISNVVKGFDGQDRKYAEISFKSGYLLSVQSKMVTDF